MNDIKRREASFHDHLQEMRRAPELHEHHEHHRDTAAEKWYTVNRRGTRFIVDHVVKGQNGTPALDYGCGAGSFSIALAGHGVGIVGVDISAASLALAKDTAQARHVRNVRFAAMDAESTAFRDNTFRVVVCNAVLHHLNLDAALPELVRILQPGGFVVALEALGHNPLINWYRRRTPHLRTSDEHPLVVQDLRLAWRYFDTVELQFFHLSTLVAVPFHRMRVFAPLLGMLERVDDLLFRIPHLRKHAWMVGVRMAGPKKSVCTADSPAGCRGLATLV